MTEEEARKLAEAHWEWLETLLHKIYVDTFIHGVKHGQNMEGGKWEYTPNIKR